MISPNSRGATHSPSSLSGQLILRIVPALVTAFLIAAAPTLPGQVFCPETNGVKFLLPPQTTNGWDILDSQGQLLADDFRCTTNGPITDIHLWGSWLNDAVGTVTNFWLGIYDDVPATNNPPSHPGTNLLWPQQFNQSQFAQFYYTTTASTSAAFYRLCCRAP